MRNLHVIQPYNDDKMSFNEITKQYQLTREYCKEMFQNTYKNDMVLDQRIEQNSDLIYDFIYSRVNTNNNQIVEALLTNTQEGREFIRKMLTYQMQADTESGYSDIRNVPAINVSNGQVIDREEIKRNQVTVAVEQMLTDSARYFGVNLAYQGTYPPYFLGLLRR